MVTRSCAGNRAGNITWRKLGWLPGLVEAAMGRCAGNMLVTTLEVCWSGNQFFWKLPGVVVQVAWLVTTRGGSSDGYQVLWKLPGAVVQVTGW